MTTPTDKTGAEIKVGDHVAIYYGGEAHAMEVEEIYPFHDVAYLRGKLVTTVEAPAAQVAKVPKPKPVHHSEDRRGASHAPAATPAATHRPARSSHPKGK